MDNSEVIIVGGGLAGLTCAIQLALMGQKTLVIERNTYPHHKVCGEYLSNEIIPYLEHLGIFLPTVGAVTINTLQFTTVSGKSIELKLPLGGMGISRYALDHLLYLRAVGLGVPFIFDTVTKIDFKDNIFEVTTAGKAEFTAPLVIGAYGKRSVLDKSMNRDFINKKSDWLGVKAHYKWDDFPENVVGLHHFNGGYGGISKTETGAVNFCYLASYKSFKAEKDMENFTRNVVGRNPFLNSFLKTATPVFEHPLTIAQISFHNKKKVENHVLMCGDSAGLIHPLCGNGMAMAIHSAKIASELMFHFLNNKGYRRAQLEYDYQDRWNATFNRRMFTGRMIQSMLLGKGVAEFGLSILARSPRLLGTLIKQTHGKPIVC